MIIVRAPLRISFAGGGSDFLDFYKLYPGKVVSTTIDKYVYVVIHPAPLQDHIMVRYSKIEIVKNVNKIKNDRVREVMKYFNIHDPLEIGVYSDLPVGTGLGGSSAFTVALIKGLAPNLSDSEIARIACKIEIDILKEPIGKQDQYACAIGGFNKFHFTERLTFFERIKRNKNFEKYLLLFYTGITREAKTILAKQKENIPDKLKLLRTMTSLADLFPEPLLKEDYEELGRLLNDGWLMKKYLAPNISNPYIDKLYNKAIKAGAWGGKLLGAGGGGCLLFIAPFNKHNAIRKSLDLKEIPFKFTNIGVEIIYE